MDYREVVAGEEEGPMGLATRELLFSAEVGEVIMVSPDFEGYVGAFEVVSEVFEGADDGEEFFVMNVVIEFCWIKGLREKGDWVPGVKGVRLFEDRSEGEVTGIGDKSVGQFFTG